ncbi:MAG TPA: hypothetical protein VIS96_12115 [Terrimicrobiaceae bacterium]
MGVVTDSADFVMSSQPSFPDSDSWGIRIWTPQKSDQSTKPIDVGGNLLLGVDWQALRTDPDEAVKERIYDTYMCSPEWIRRRKQALDRANGFCEQCHRHFEGLEVHHLTYERFTRERPEDLEALCHHCHPGRDKERREALAAVWDERQQESEERAEENRFAAYVRKSCDGLGLYEISADELSELREKFERLERGEND